MTKPHATRWPDGTPRSTANAFEWRERQAAGTVWAGLGGRAQT